MADTLSVDQIVTKDTQARAALSETIITEYAEALERGEEFPPVDVYFDDHTYWLADGFHRLYAARRVDRKTIAATIHPGSKREALLHAVGANETHGHRRTEADRRHAVTILLTDPEWRLWSDREIARQCRVSHMLVNRVRHEITPPETERATKEPRKVQRAGKVYTMQTGRIGTAKKQVPAKPSAATPVRPVSRTPVAPPEPSVVPSGTTEDVSVTALQIDPPEVTAAPLPEPTAEPTSAAPSAALPHEPVAPPAPADTPEAPPEPQIDVSPPVSVRQTDESRLTVLVRVWSDATLEERQTFVTVHQAELRTMLAALSIPDPKKAVASARSVRKTRAKKEKS